MSNNLELLKIIIPAAVTSLVTALAFLRNHKLDKLRVRELELKIKQLEKTNSDLLCEKNDSEKKINFFNQLISLTNINNLHETVNKLFLKTRANKFSILVAINGKTDFNVMSVVYEQHANNNKEDSYLKYANIKIDNYYKTLLKQSELEDFVCLDTEKMPDCLLKDIFMSENIQHSILKSIIRKPIDNENDFLVYSHISSFSKVKYTRLDILYIKNAIESVVIPNIAKLVE